MKLAIILAVPRYSASSVADLVACQNDGAAMADLLKADGRFDDILRLTDSEPSHEVKSKIVAFVEAYKAEEVEELVFYFSGHGHFLEDDLLMLLSDYHPDRKRQTSLSNSEIDALVRTIGPTIYGKLVDACNSGVPYIKGADTLEMSVKGAKGSFEKLYFMFSSQQDESSYTDDTLSFFTNSVIGAVVNSGDGTVRYNDVISYVADDFDGEGGQTPFFITQADMTETFCTVQQSAMADLGEYLRPESEAETADESDQASSSNLIDRIAEEAARYCDEDQAVSIVEGLRESVEAAVKLDELAVVFDRRVSASEDEPPNPKAIGEWLRAAPDRPRYFAKETTKSEEYQREKPISVLAAATFSAFQTHEPEYETAYRTVVDGYSNSWASPFTHLNIRLEPNYASVTPEALFLCPLVSATELRLFYAYCHYEYTDWTSSRRAQRLEWHTRVCDIMDPSAIAQMVEGISLEFVDFVRADLAELYAL